MCWAGAKPAIVVSATASAAETALPSLATAMCRPTIWLMRLRLAAAEARSCAAALMFSVESPGEAAKVTVLPALASAASAVATPAPTCVPSSRTVRLLAAVNHVGWAISAGASAASGSEMAMCVPGAAAKPGSPSSFVSWAMESVGVPLSRTAEMPLKAEGAAASRL